MTIKPAMLKSVSELTRVHFESPRSFDEVRTALRQLLGTSRLQEVVNHVRAVREAEDFERIVQPLAGESGFMLFLEIDYSGWLPLYGISRKAVRLIFGNPLIGITMIRHDIEAALFAPVELLLFESDDGAGSTVIYDLPSSLMRAKTNPKLLAATQALDAKFEALVSRATGVAVS